MNRVIAACAALAFALPVSAQDATLAKVAGEVFIVAPGSRKRLPAKGGESLIYGDMVRVGKGGVAHLTLGERGAVLLREETELTLQGSPARTVLNVPVGEFLVGLKRKLLRGEAFRVRTRAAVAAVRGTLFWGKSDAADKSTTYAGFGHTVAVTAQGKTVLVTPGKTVVVAFGAPPAEPVASTVGLDYAKKFEVDGSLEDLEALAEADKLKPAP